jgi:hypothetical protein
MAAMYLGRDAKEAVEVAISLSATCGNGIDTITLGEGSTTREGKVWPRDKYLSSQDNPVVFPKNTPIWDT